MFLYSNPWKEMEQFRKEIDDMFTRVGRGSSYRFPPVNLYDTNDAVVAEVIVPGMKKDM